MYGSTSRATAVFGAIALLQGTVGRPASVDPSRAARSAPSLLCDNAGECASSCAEARDSFGADADGLYLLKLKVDAKRIDEYDAGETRGCGVRRNSADVWPTVLKAQYAPSGYSPGAEIKCLERFDFSKNEVIRQELEVYCSMMGRGPKSAGITPRAYLEVDPQHNFAAMAYADALHTTVFSKLRFDERFQFIYNADYTFASTISGSTTPCGSPCGYASKFKENCDVSGVFNMPFGTAGACRQFQDAGSGSECALPNESDSADLTATMEWDFTPPTASTRGTVHVSKRAHTNSAIKPNYDVFFVEYDFTNGGTPYAGNSEPWFQNDADKAAADVVGVSGSRSITASNVDASTCKVGGPEVGLMVDNRVDLDVDTGEVDVTMNYLAPINLAVGGWGFPICIGDNTEPNFRPYYASAAYPGREVMPLNCVSGRNVQDDNDFGVGRVRNQTYGYEQHFYEESFRTQCDPNTEEIVGISPTAADVHTDRVCKNATTTTTTTESTTTTTFTNTTTSTTTTGTKTSTTTTTNTNIEDLLQKLADIDCDTSDLQPPTESPYLIGPVSISDITQMFLDATLLGPPDTEKCKQLKAVLVNRELAQSPTTTTTTYDISSDASESKLLSPGLVAVAVLAGLVFIAIVAIIVWIRFRDPHKPKARNPVTVVQSPNKKGLSTPYYSSTHYRP